MPDRIACILDFDGVVVDSEPAHAAAKVDTLDRFGIAYPADLTDGWLGRTDADFFDFVATTYAPPGVDAVALNEAKFLAYQARFADVALVPGVEAFLAAARPRFRRLGLATSATARDVGLVMERFGLAPFFDAIVTRDDTSRHKPDPEPYLVTLARLGVSAGEAFAVEDSPNGVHAAAGAGLLVVGLVGAFPAGVLLEAGATRIVTSLAALTDDLDELAGRPG